MNRKKRVVKVLNGQIKAQNGISKNHKRTTKKLSSNGHIGNDKTCDLPVFECCPIKSQAVRVLSSEQGAPYSVLLQHIDSAHNHHKFYAMQALKIDDAHFACLFWWGRIGSSGRKTLVKSSKKETTINSFCRRFSSKTGLNWEQRNQPGKAGQYHVVELSTPQEIKPPKSEDNFQIAGPKIIPKSRLPLEAQHLFSSITDRATVAKEILKVEPHYQNTLDRPLGRLTPAQLKGGYACLREIEELMAQSKPNKKKLSDASDIFYSMIPHEFGIREVPPVISTSDLVKEKAGLLNTLAEAQIAIRRLEEAEAVEANGKTNHLDALHNLIAFKLELLQPNTDVFNLIQEYLFLNHAPAHNFDLKLKAIFEVKERKEKFRFKDLGNKVLLWHGCRLPTVVGILSHGLQISPPETPSDRFMFGRGLYFADSSSESAKYCHAGNGEEAVLVLAEVSLGDANTKAAPDFNARNLPRGKNSVFGKGRKAPDCSENKHPTLFDDVKVPVGAIKKVFGRKGDLPLNEYTIYDETQARLRFLVHVQLSAKSND
ncbi:unnamed protein product, partial [Mesorhabditis belari]|uniref:Poly [ADP-ribose] polymerase n=1 Tax=Mesorhabditis belari TaxID=2138241 RepID=A0AAF3F755_9BILA